ncbi:hypothetical protein [Candidatus Viridilinea mediisalina]|uniref:Uncharacterized protein n=1 Tax=Candidatus Viridilinea mediisalina TaxID=2024553 RepID=A0A2A6REM9_9CHLR|nr:hypothetical protein [Candidatus Viridilinea mediisalina]PDW01517.1 hypothetical protein CJ255_18690 [Candidatus Viridilinea mediisalina]
MRDPLTTVLGLVAVTIFAGIFVFVLLRYGTSPERRHSFILGYPPTLFPNQQLVALPALIALAASQARLMQVYAKLQPRSTAQVWLHAYLTELRGIMDAAYKAAEVALIYEHTELLDRIATEVATSERSIAQEAMRHLLHNERDLDLMALDVRLATLQRFARELARA